LNVSGFLSAYASHQAGKIDEAERGYRSVVAADPRHADAWHLLGVIEQQRGKSDLAVKHIRRALKLHGPQPAYLSNLGVALESLGKSREAVIALRQAVSLDARAFSAYMALGNSLRSLHRFEEALAAYQHALELMPDSASLHNNLGSTYQNLGRLNEASACYRKTIALQPRHPRAHYNLGTVLKTAGQLDEAAVCFRAALSITPELLEAHINLGTVLHDLGDLEGAIHHARAVIARDPKNAAAYNNLGAAQRDAGELDQAMESYAAAIALRPSLAEARHNQGVALQRMGRDDEALERFQDAQDVGGGLVEAQQNAALIMLMRGDFKAGWDAYECRWLRNLPGLGVRNFPYPRWQGECDAGGIVVWGEQGVGDRILYSGMIPDLLAQGHNVVMETDTRLKNLFERSFPGLKVVAKSDPPHPETARHDIRWHSPLASLGRWLRPDLESFPKRSAYLTADPERRAAFKAFTAALPGTGPVVGLSWHSRNVQIGQQKSLALLGWRQLLQIPGLRLIDLQYGDTSEERSAFEREAGITVHHVPDLDLRDDIDGTAALAAACDLVISVSNSTAHLAAALGRPTWIMVPAGGGNLWYWMRGSDHTPWYPAARIFRQDKPGEWQGVIACLQERLQNHLVNGLPLQQIN